MVSEPQQLSLQAGTWTIDPSHSLIEFSARHFTIARVKGRFTRFSGSITVDPNDLLKSTVQLEIDATSVESQGIGPREDLIRGEELLQTDRFPTISFRSTRIAQAGPGEFLVSGDLTLHGVTRAVEIPMAFGGLVVTRMGARAGFSGAISLSRKAFAIPFDHEFQPGSPVVSDDVQIELEIEVVPQAG